MKLTSGISRQWPFFLCLLLAAGISLLWPGDALWGDSDQATIVWQALQANASGRLSAYHNVGALVDLHPLTIWACQLLLLVTRDLIRLILIKQLLVTVVCVAGLYYLSEALNYNKYVILLFFLSFFHQALIRTQVDNSFLAPLSLLLFVCFVRFSKRKGYTPLIGWCVCAVAIFHFHPRGVIAAVPFVIAFVVFERDWLKKHRLGVLAVLAGSGLACLPFLLSILERLHLRYASGLYALPERTVFSLSVLPYTAVSEGFWYSYDMLQLIPDTAFRAYGLFPGMARALIGFTMAGYLFLTIGLVLTVFGLIRRLRRREAFTLEDRLGLVSLLTIVFYMMLLYRFALFNHWQYHPGLWFCGFYFIWRAVTAMRQVKGVKYLFPAYLAVMIVFRVGSLAVVHNSNRILTIKKATEIAARISTYAPESEIVQLVRWEDDGEKFADRVIANADHAVLGFYYRPLGVTLKAACRTLQALHVNLLFNALRPLVYIQRLGKRDFLPARTLVIKNDDGPEKRGVILIDDPGQVRAELERLSGKDRN